LRKEGEEKDFNMKFVQISLHHIKAATAVLSRKLDMGKANITFTRKHWVQGGKIRLLGVTEAALQWHTVQYQNPALI
jgi:hypothetical protein